MNLVGKILVMLILVMSLVFMGFAVAVYSTHKNWKEVVTLDANAAREQGKKVGLIQQRDDLKKKYDEVSAQFQALQTEVDNMKKGYDDKVAKLETERDALAKESTDAKTSDAMNKQTLDKTVAELTAAQTTLDQKLKQIDTLREDIKKAIADRDANFNKLVEQTDAANKATLELQSLKGEEDRLRKENARFKAAMNRSGVNPDAPLGPPTIDGVVLAAANNNLVEISLGSDDGLSPGNTLEVSRGKEYIGRVEVVTTRPEKAVAKVVPGYQKKKIEKEDRVQTRFN
jgi:septal ring factor EnvC (AmiA/AmiB activator)